MKTYAILAALFVSLSVRGESHTPPDPAGGSGPLPQKDCKTCAFYEGYNMLWHRGDRLPADYAANHQEKGLGVRGNYPGDMWASVNCGDSDRSGYCGGFKDEAACKGEPRKHCYWQGERGLRCDLAPKHRLKFGGVKTLADLTTLRKECEAKKEIGCKADANCQWVVNEAPCLPLAEVMTCGRANQRPEEVRKQCCEALDGCGWNATDGKCGPWDATVKSCEFWLQGTTSQTGVSFSNHRFPAAPLITMDQFYQSWDTHVTDGSPAYEQRLKNQCRKVEHLFDGHGRSQWSAARDVAAILGSQDQLQEVEVQHWGCSTFSRTNEKSDFAREREGAQRHVAETGAAFFGSLPGVFQGGLPLLAATFGPFSQALETFGTLMENDPRQVFRQIVVPRWREQKAKGREVKVTLMANQLTAHARGTATESRGTNTPFAIGIHDGKLVQWPARCATTVQCGTGEEGNQFLCRLPATEDWTARIAPPDFSRLGSERVVAWRCESGRWVTGRSFPNFQFVLETL